jgi:adenylate kinase family enzyme
MRTRHEAVLLLGPTGSGKTPLGEMLQTRGLSGRRCVHFDFGEEIRQAVARGREDRFVSLKDIQLLRRTLEAGALLEDKEFPVAERILQRFLACRGADREALIVLNGLPRHVGQAESVAERLDVRTVVCLRCRPETAIARIAANTGGDRADRTDDDLAAVREKLAVYAERTAPLADHYRAAGARLVGLDVTAEMTPEQAWRLLNKRLAADPGQSAGAGAES